MKSLRVVAALLVFVAIGLALVLERPEPLDESVFGEQVALPANLTPLPFPSGALELAGSVRASSGTPASDALVTLLRADDEAPESEPLYWCTTDEQGRFRLQRLSAGEYRVVLTHPSAPPKSFDFSLPHEGEVSWELAVPLPPLPTLPEIRRGPVQGQVLAPASRAAEAGAPLSVDPGGCEVVFRPAPGGIALSGAAERRTPCDAAGNFALPELVLARYQVEVLPPWARGGSWPVLASGVFDAASGTANSLALTLEVGMLEGLLLEAEGRPLEGALVKVSALDARDAVGEPQVWPPSVTDPEGRFRIALLPPGRYRVHLRAGLAERDVEVVVAAGQSTSVPLDPMDPRAGK